MKFFKSRFFVFCLIGAILLTLVPTLTVAFGGVDILRSALGTISKPFTMCASGIANAFNGFAEVFSQYDELKAENEELKSKLKEYENKQYNEELLREQNEWLKNYINLHNENPELVFTDARIIARESNNYSTVLTLNKGSINGIKLNMPVMTDKGLLGHVCETGLDWCRVVPITDYSSSIGAYTERSGILGVVEGNAELSRDGLCTMTHLSGSGIEVGDKVYTSGGDTSIYPPGLFIGQVSATSTETGDLVAQISPAVDFNDLGNITSVLIISNAEK